MLVIQPPKSKPNPCIILKRYVIHIGIPLKFRQRISNHFEYHIPRLVITARKGQTLLHSGYVILAILDKTKTPRVLLTTSSGAGTVKYDTRRIDVKACRVIDTGWALKQQKLNF